MSKTKKVVLIGALSLGGLIIAAILSANILIKRGVTYGVKEALGIRIEIDDIEVRLLRDRYIRIEGLTVYSPEGFHDTVMARIPLISLDYELGPLLNNQLISRLVELNVEEVTVVLNKDGKVNLNEIPALKEEETQESPPAEEQKETEIKIDRLYLTFNKVKYLDYTDGDEAKERNLSIGLVREEFQNLTSIDDIIKVVVLRTVIGAGLTNIGVAAKSIADGLSGVTGAGMESLNKGMSVLRQTGTRIKQGVLSGTEKIKAGTEKIKEKTKGLFNKLKGLGKD